MQSAQLRIVNWLPSGDPRSLPAWSLHPTYSPSALSNLSSQPLTHIVTTKQVDPSDFSPALFRLPSLSLPLYLTRTTYIHIHTHTNTRTHTHTYIASTHAISAVLPSLSLSAFPPHSPIQGSTGSQVYLSLSLSLLANFFSYCLYYMTPATSVHRPNNHPLPHLLPPDTFASLKRAVSFICCMRPMC